MFHEYFCTGNIFHQNKMKQGTYQQKTWNVEQETWNRKRKNKIGKPFWHCGKLWKPLKPIAFIVFQVPLFLFSDCLLFSLLSFSLSDLLCGRAKLVKMDFFLHRFALAYDYFHKSIPQRYFDKLTFTKPRIICTTPRKLQTLKLYF